MTTRPCGSPDSPTAACRLSRTAETTADRPAAYLEYRPGVARGGTRGDDRGRCGRGRCCCCCCCCAWLVIVGASTAGTAGRPMRWCGAAGARSSILRQRCSGCFCVRANRFDLFFNATGNSCVVVAISGCACLFVRRGQIERTFRQQKSGKTAWQKSLT